MHSLLQRQLKKCFGTNLPDDPSLRRLVEMVDAAYTHADVDRAMVERSMEISSRELHDRNEKIAAAEKKYRQIFENVSEGIFQIDPGGKILSANPAMAAIFGYPDAETLRASITDIGAQFFILPGRWEEIVREVERHGSITNWESQMRRADGSLIWVSKTIHRLPGDAGGAAYLEGTLFDITVRKTAEAEKEQMQQRLIDISRQAGMAEIATGVLHNVGNVLNSVNVSVSIAVDRLRASRLSGLDRLASLLRGHEHDLPTFLTEDAKGRQIIPYLASLSESLAAEQREILNELSGLIQNVDHIKQIVKSQQNFARSSGISESISLAELIEDAVHINAESLERHRIRVDRDIAENLVVKVDKHQVLQILVNLVSNAKHAMRCSAGERILTIRAGALSADPSRLLFIVSDTGTGIAAENITRIFSHGFTTRTDGHGFGLHTSALAAKNMGGSLTASSEGLGRGAVFTLDIPLVADKQKEHSWKAA
ncbi:MAG: ATP-binding protein [Phycisphaerae bacterium]